MNKLTQFKEIPKRKLVEFVFKICNNCCYGFVFSIG